MAEFAERWPTIADRLRATEERYRANRVRSTPNWPPSAAELAPVMSDVREVIDLYLAATAAERALVREFFRDSDYLIRGPLQQAAAECAVRFEQTSEGRWLDRALAACSIEDLRIDYRDTYQWLGSLYIVATERGIDPEPFFQAAANLSGDEGESGFSTRRFIAGFSRSSFFAASVAPKLGGHHPV